MTYPHIPILKLNSSKPRAAGQQHGETLKEKIAEIAEIRWELMRKEPGFNSNSLVKEISLAHMPVLEQFDADLYEELVGISEGSGQSLERIVVLNHYTDLRDLSYSLLSAASPSQGKFDDGGCSTLFVPTEHGPILGQTWDIHSSALPFVTMLEIEQRVDGRELGSSMVFSMAGCLGMTGLSSQGVAITINNLCSLDATIGVIWPALVRKVLKQPDAKAGKSCVLNASIGSGHHYVIADSSDLFAISTSGTKKKVITQNSHEIHFHTNHCVDDEMAKTHTVRPTSTTFDRRLTLARLVDEEQFTTGLDVFEAFGQVSSAPHQSPSNVVGTCGAMVMDISQKTVFACAGPPSKKYFDNGPSTYKL